MKNNKAFEPNRIHILITIAIIFILIFAQAHTVSRITENKRILASLREESKSIAALAHSAEKLSLLCNKFISDDTFEMPASYENINKFYSAILKEFSSRSLENVSVTKNREVAGVSSFVISGTGDYWELVQTLASFRSRGYLKKISSLELFGEDKNIVRFIIVVEAAIESSGNNKEEKSE